MRRHAICTLNCLKIEFNIPAQIQILGSIKRRDRSNLPRCKPLLRYLFFLFKIHTLRSSSSNLGRIYNLLFSHTIQSTAFSPLSQPSILLSQISIFLCQVNNSNNTILGFQTFQWHDTIVKFVSMNNTISMSFALPQSVENRPMMIKIPPTTLHSLHQY